MSSFSHLPSEVQTLVLKSLPISDLLQVRFLNHHFHRLATDVVFAQITVDFSNLDALFDVVSRYAGVSGSRLPAKNILIDTTRWGKEEIHLTSGFSMIAALLPHLLDLTKASLCLMGYRNQVKEKHFAIIGRFVRLPSLVHLQIDNFPLDPGLFFGSNLRIIEFKYECRGDYGLTSGLEYILMLLNACQHLHTLKIPLDKCTVNGQLLHEFVEHHLAHETRHENMRDLDLILLESDDQDVPDVNDLVHFCSFLMPQLVSMHLEIDMPECDRIAGRTQVGSYVANDTSSCRVTRYPPLQLRLYVQENLAVHLLDHLPRSLAHSLDLSLYAESNLSLPWLQGMTSLIALSIGGGFPVTINALDDAFATMPAAASLKKLILSHCSMDSPVTLERAISKLHSLSSLHLNYVTFTTHPPRPRATIIENPWISMLSDYFERHQTTDNASLVWISLPAPPTAIHVSVFNNYVYEGSLDCVCILLQDQQHSIGKNVRIWFCYRDDHSFYGPRNDGHDELDEDEIVEVLSALPREPDTNPEDDAGEMEHLSTDLAEWTLATLREKKCTVYVCSSATSMEFIEPNYDV
ncbi:hypothetical protein BC940DRAFT_367761 [Gongronella butleri]|nr:hypothetical protein BC940DRAFT_367761 [Gongronella butleri]